MEYEQPSVRPPVEQGPDPVQVFSPSPVNPNVPKKLSWKMPAILACIILALGVGLFFTMQSLIPDRGGIESNAPENSMPNDPAVSADCSLLPDSLEKCESFHCPVINPATKEVMMRDVFGAIDNICQYSEGLPEGKRMNCQLTEDMRMALASQYRHMLALKAGTETSKEAPKYTVGGKEIANPRQEAINSGQCVSN